MQYLKDMIFKITTNYMNYILGGALGMMIVGRGLGCQRSNPECCWYHWESYEFNCSP